MTMTEYFEDDDYADDEVVEAALEVLQRRDQQLAADNEAYWDALGVDVERAQEVLGRPFTVKELEGFRARWEAAGEDDDIDLDFVSDADTDEGRTNVLAAYLEDGFFDGGEGVEGAEAESE
jgi:hypothetical protein